MILYGEEYTTPDGEAITIQYDDVREMWEVACWDADEQCRWYLEFPTEIEARAEYERWR